jgi:hypothetical protein
MLALALSLMVQRASSSQIQMGSGSALRKPIVSYVSIIVIYLTNSKILG